MSHVQNITDTRNTNTCDMYKSSLRHIHDPVLLSQDRNYTCNLIFILICVQQDATLHGLFYLETALHVSLSGSSNYTANNPPRM